MKQHAMDLERLAKLAHMTLTQEESQEFSREFDELFSFLDSITETDFLAPQMSNHADFLREDEPHVGLCRDELLANAEATADGCITVPLMMEDV